MTVAVLLLVDFDKPNFGLLRRFDFVGLIALAAFLGSLVFRVESQCVDRRLRWPTGDDLLRMSDLESRGLPPVRMAEAYALLRNDLPLLDDLRRKTIGSNFR